MGRGFAGGKLQIPHFVRDDNLWADVGSRPLQENARSGAPDIHPRAKIRVRGSGQECPLYTTLSRFLYFLKLGDLDSCFREVGGDFSSPGRGLRKAWGVVLLAANCRSLTLFGMTIYGRTWDPAPCKKTRGAGHPTSTRVQKTESEAADRSVRSTQPLAAFFTSSKLGDLDGCFREVGGILVLRAGV